MTKDNHSPGATRPTVTGPDDGPRLQSGPNEITLKVTSAHGQKFALAEFRVAPRFVAPPVLHHHSREDWAAYVVEGEVVFAFADGDVRAPAGTTVFIPAGADFAWRNDRDEPARFLAVYAPAGFERFFLDVADAVAARGGQTTPPVMREVIPPLWRKYAIIPRTPDGD